MNEYIISLALAYFKEKGDKYEVGELMELLGYTWSKLSDLLDKLMVEQLITYSDNLIHITNKGLTCLIARNQINMSIQKDKIDLLCIQPEDAQSTEVPYVPLKFLRKYPG